jgi:hypothetical protein
MEQFFAQTAIRRNATKLLFQAGSMRINKEINALDCASPLQETDGQKENGAQEAEHTAHGDTHNTERQKKQPNDGIQNQREKRQRPAQAEQNAPQQEDEHTPPHLLLRSGPTGSSMGGEGI